MLTLLLAMQVAAASPDPVKMKQMNCVNENVAKPIRIVAAVNAYAVSHDEVKSPSSEAAMKEVKQAFVACAKKFAWSTEEKDAFRKYLYHDLSILHLFEKHKANEKYAAGFQLMDLIHDKFRRGEIDDTRRYEMYEKVNESFKNNAESLDEEYERESALFGYLTLLEFRDDEEKQFLASAVF
jgi:non-canonical (house-cleaning) NTP pyrophosphatase